MNEAEEHYRGEGCITSYQEVSAREADNNHDRIAYHVDRMAFVELEEQIHEGYVYTLRLARLHNRPVFKRRVRLTNRVKYETRLYVKALSLEGPVLYQEDYEYKPMTIRQAWRDLWWLVGFKIRFKISYWFREKRWWRAYWKSYKEHNDVSAKR